jgi:hypothetical protein
MAMAMAMAMVMVLAIVILYQKYLYKQVGYVNISIKASTDLESSTSQIFYRPRAFY